MFLLILTMFTLLINIHGKCPLGSIEIDSDIWCYNFFAAPDTFDNAEAQCRKFNGHLTSISNGFSNSDIANTLNQLVGNNANVWLGGNKQDSSWSWTDGTPFSYTNWVKNQPGSNLCVSIVTNNGQWYGSDCSANLPYLCEVPKISDGSCTNAAVTYPPPKYTFPCDSEWTYFNVTNSCYKIFHNKAWQDAENYCKNFGAHLTSIHSLQENIFICEFSTSGLTVAADAWTDEVWIGFNDLSNVGDYSWSDGSTVDYINWSPVDPNNPSTQQCIFIYADEMSTVPERVQKWGVAPCSWVFRAFVCKKPANLLK